MSFQEITPETDRWLKSSIDEYRELIQSPCYMPVGAFAINHFGLAFGATPQSLILAHDNSISVQVREESGVPGLVNIDTFVVAPTSIVKPNFYNESGDVDAREGIFMRVIDRALSEVEARSLIADMTTIGLTIPRERLRP